MAAVRRRQIKKDYVKQVERELYSYPALLAAIVTDDLPGLTARYSGMPGGGDIANHTEAVAIKRAEKTIRVKRIERAIDALTFLERDLIKYKYFDPGQPSDVAVMVQISLKNTAYYKFKEQALRKLATALNII